MVRSSPVLRLTILVALCCPAVARAGMPSLTLSDVARLRIETISFFLVVFLLSSLVIQRLWNYLRKDFAFLPRLTFGKALGLITLWGLLFVLVLTMISGARELMTPGAWKKDGLTYKLADDSPSPSPEEYRGPRRDHLELLHAALREQADAQGGHFPETSSAAKISTERWIVPGTSQTRYLYVGGLTREGLARPLAYEPDVHGEVRLVLFTDGTIRPMTLEELAKILPEKG